MIGVNVLTCVFLFILLYQINFFTYNYLSGKGVRFLVYSTAAIGTPIHELSHAFLCLVFRHKIKKISLFSANGSGVLGYVQHTYNPSSYYQSLGQVFIGLAPIVGGLCIVELITELLFPQINIRQFIRLIELHLSTNESVIAASDELMIYIKLMIDTYIDLSFDYPYRFFLWVFLVSSILSHLTPSPADFVGVRSGLIYFVGGIILTCFVGINAAIYEIALQLTLYLTAIIISFFPFVILHNVVLIVVGKILTLKKEM
ncbi:hypothetical protein EIJ81_00470 (plasmid) [Aliivibrio salmonicida]|uniref:hypothetical protein n=1 Tax=Aliivibrio salmonicida TaxID=40269 RepID=UPI000F6B5715|nr:hypothetical protein [Aliivibrio salmonicida]AZL83373.1 hypothetical protein EIJ81_00470 [Aliivibrio salmonicida]